MTQSPAARETHPFSVVKGVSFFCCCFVRLFVFEWLTVQLPHSVPLNASVPSFLQPGAIRPEYRRDGGQGHRNPLESGTSRAPGAGRSPPPGAPPPALTQSFEEPALRPACAGCFSCTISNSSLGVNFSLLKANSF